MNTKENEKENGQCAFTPRPIPRSRIASDGAEKTMESISEFILYFGIGVAVVLLLVGVVGAAEDKGLMVFLGAAIAAVPIFMGSICMWAALKVFANISLRLKTLQEAFADTGASEDYLQVGDIIIRNLDGMEYYIKEIRPEGIIIDTEDGLRQLTSEDYTLKQ